MKKFGEVLRQAEEPSEKPAEKSPDDKGVPELGMENEKKKELTKLHELGKLIFNHYSLNEKLVTARQKDKKAIKDSISSIEGELETEFLSRLERVRGLEMDFDDKSALVKLFADYDWYLRRNNPHSYSNVYAIRGPVERAKAVEVISDLATDGLDSFKSDEWKRLRDLEQRKNSKEKEGLTTKEFYEFNRLIRKSKRIERFLVPENWKKLDYEPFDPALEMRKVNHFSPEERRNLPPDRIREIKEERLARYKEQLSKQKKEITEIQIKLEEFIREDPDLGFDRLMELVLLKAPKAKLAGYQIEIFRKGLITYTKKHEAVERFRKQYKNDEDLFKACFGRLPKGRFEVIKGPASLYFRCYDLEDYTLIYTQKFGQSEALDNDDMEAASLSGGVSISGSNIPELEGCIIAENARGTFFERESSRTHIHEEQHVIKKFFEEENLRQSLFRAPAKFQEKKILENYLRAVREKFENRAKDEILAYFKEDKGPNQIKEILFRSKEEGGLYDYFEEWYEERGKTKKELIVNAGFDENLVDDIFFKIFIREYKQKIINPAIESIWTLRSKGFLKEEIINLLVNEPLSKWSKIVRRIDEVG